MWTNSSSGVDLFLRRRRRRRRLKYLFPMDDGESHVLLGFRVFFSCFGRRRLLLLLLLLWYMYVCGLRPLFLTQNFRKQHSK